MNYLDLVRSAEEAQTMKWNDERIGKTAALAMFGVWLSWLLEEPNPETVEHIVERLQSEINEVELKGQSEDLQETV